MKIVELVIDELEGLFGFDAVALVNQPAIEAEFHAFNSHNVDDAIAYQIIKRAVFEKIKEDFVTKLPGETKDEYISRCIPVVMKEGYDQDQAAAICYSDWESFDETLDPQEIVIGDYQTRHFDMCPAATALYSKIESQEIDVDMGLAIRSAKLQDALYWLEKHTVKQMGHASFDDVKAAEVLAGEIMHLARMMGLEQEHQYILGHVQAIRNLYQQGQEEEQLEIETNLPDYTHELPRKKKFESYDDYPQAASNNAARAVKYAEENGWGDCGTAVGKARAHQLANREPISEETIARMSSFRRHQQHKDVPYEEGCGGLMWDAWGGEEGIAWAERKLDQIREEQKSQKFSFSLEEDQQIVVGPLMIPNKLIFRVDENGEPYYVYFTEETIQKIARKMMEEKKLDSINLEHIQDHTVDGNLIETWLVEDTEKDKQQIYGMDYQKGTWMGMYKVEDPAIWQKVKNGELKGFSIEGYFADRLVQR